MGTVKIKFDERAIDAICRDLDQLHLPGAAVGISLGGATVYAKGFGLASMELPTLLSPSIRMRIYSTSKHFTCLAYLLFCEEGRAEIDDPIGKYLPALHPVTRSITMRQLMSHTSGLRDACDIRWFFSGIDKTVPARDLVGLYRHMQDVNFAPDEDWCYNNGGYHILSAVIEKLADAPLEEVLSRRIFQPVGMHDTLLRRVDTNFVPNSASMHMTALGGGYERKYLPGELLGEGGIVSTVNDMLRWLKHMANPVVGTPETWALMSTSHRLRNGGETGYGLGLFRRPYRSFDTISHGGGGLGNSSQMIRVPAAGLDVVAIVNRHDVNAAELAGRILDACLDIKPTVPRVAIACAAGLFQSPTTGRVIWLHSKENAQVAFIDGAECPMEVDEIGVLRPLPWSLWNYSLRLLASPSRPDGLRCEFWGRPDELQPVSSTQSTTLESLAGEYVADSIGVRLTVRGQGLSGELETVGQFGSKAYRLESLGQRLWKFGATDATAWSGIIAACPGRKAIFFRTWGTLQVLFRCVS